MATAAGTRRQARVVADQQAAKARRQLFLAGALGAILLILVVVEVPKVFKSSGSSSSSSAAPATPSVSPATPAAPASSSAALRKLLRQAPHDVFAVTPSAGENTLGSLATPPGLHDPFAAPNSAEAVVAPVAPTTPVKTPALPSKIVLGTPGPGKVAVAGWIVILASIPTAQGQSSATAFAAQAGKAGVGSTSILNSSNRRPLRGGFWVVYTGPYSTLNQVSVAADNVHKAGFSSAYIRELVVYKQKPATAKKTAKKKK